MTEQEKDEPERLRRDLDEQDVDANKKSRSPREFESQHTNLEPGANALDEEVPGDPDD